MSIIISIILRSLQISYENTVIGDATLILTASMCDAIRQYTIYSVCVWIVDTTQGHIFPHTHFLTTIFSSHKI